MHVQGGRRGESSHEADEAARRFRNVLGRFASGVTSVTGSASHGPVGLTVQSFMSVSLEPPLIAFSPSRSSRAWPYIEASGSFCVNILAASQLEVARRMATRGADKFGGVEWTRSPVTGSPLLSGVAGYVDCRIESVHEAGDHFVVVGRVVDLGAGEDVPVLTYFRGRYGGVDLA